MNAIGERIGKPVLFLFASLHGSERCYFCSNYEYETPTPHLGAVVVDNSLQNAAEESGYNRHIYLYEHPAMERTI